MTGPRIGSLCTGYGGLDTAVQAVYGGTLAWTSDIDPGASRIIAHHHPQVPNLGDLTTTDWDQVEPVDIVCGGYPCQPFSNAGLRKGTADERHIWPHIARALGVLRPRLAIFENVAGHLRRGFDTVLADLARLGFDAEWCTLRASEVGAPHQRQRLFILATAADAPDLGHERGRAARGRRPGPSDGDLAAAHTSRTGLEVRTVEHHGPQRPPVERSGGQPAADAPGDGRHERRTEPARQQGRPGAPGSGSPDWGSYGPAISRWEAVTGRAAPWATDDRNRLSPLFVEWLMGLPAGHVTAVPGLSRNQQLKALGNGVVPHQAEAAIRLLHARAMPAALGAAA